MDIQTLFKNHIKLNKDTLSPLDGGTAQHQSTSIRKQHPWQIRATYVLKLNQNMQTWKVKNKSAGTLRKNTKFFQATRRKQGRQTKISFFFISIINKYKEFVRLMYKIFCFWPTSKTQTSWMIDVHLCSGKNHLYKNMNYHQTH